MSKSGRDIMAVHKECGLPFECAVPRCFHNRLQIQDEVNVLGRQQQTQLARTHL